jgi:hypothetical protein
MPTTTPLLCVVVNAAFVGLAPGKISSSPFLIKSAPAFFPVCFSKPRFYAKNNKEESAEK